MRLSGVRGGEIRLVAAPLPQKVLDGGWVPRDQCQKNLRRSRRMPPPLLTVEQRFLGHTNTARELCLRHPGFFRMPSTSGTEIRCRRVALLPLYKSQRFFEALRDTVIGVDLHLHIWLRSRLLSSTAAACSALVRLSLISHGERRRKVSTRFQAQPQ